MKIIQALFYLPTRSPFLAAGLLTTAVDVWGKNPAVNLLLLMSLMIIMLHCYAVQLKRWRLFWLVMILLFVGLWLTFLSLVFPHPSGPWATSWEKVTVWRGLILGTAIAMVTVMIRHLWAYRRYRQWLNVSGKRSLWSILRYNWHLVVQGYRIFRNHRSSHKPSGERAAGSGAGSNQETSVDRRRRENSGGSG